MESDWFTKASGHLEQNQLAQALFCVRQGRKTARDIGQLLTRKDVFEALGCFSVSDAIHRILRSRNPDSPVLMLSQAHCAASQKDYVRSESWNRQADEKIARDPDRCLPRSTTLILLGSSIIRQGRIRDAIEVYQQAVSLPDDGKNDIDEAWENIGYGYRALGELEMSRDAFQNAFKKGSECRGEIADLESAIALKRTPQAMNEIDIAALLNKGKMAQALACSEHQLSLNPDSRREIENRARVLTWLRRFDEAEYQIQSLDQCQPDRGPLYKLILMAELEECRGDIVSAIRFYREAIQHAPNSVNFLMELGQCLQLRQNLDEARDAYLAALKLIENDYFGDPAEAHAALASVYRMTANFAEAAEHYCMAASIEPKSRHYRLARNDAAAAAKLQTATKPFTPEELN